MRLALERLSEVLAQDHACRERERGGERGCQLEHAVLAVREEGEPPIDVESRQQRHDRRDHHDERRDAEAAGGEVADRADGDGRGRRSPGRPDLGGVDGQQDPLSERRDQGHRDQGAPRSMRGEREGRGGEGGPNTVTPTSARPAAPGLKLVSPTPSMSPTVRPAPTPAMMPAVFSMASMSRALAVTGSRSGRPGWHP